VVLLNQRGLLVTAMARADAKDAELNATSNTSQETSQKITTLVAFHSERRQAHSSRHHYPQREGQCRVVDQLIKANRRKETVPILFCPELDDMRLVM
jgi:hypothetical protein